MFDQRKLMKGCKYNRILCGRNYEWRRRLKRKVEDVYYEGSGGWGSVEVEVEILKESMALRELARQQIQTIEELSRELEEERNAAASAADETMTMISRLQKEKAELQMEASQFKRLAEGKLAHDQQELADLENLLYRKEEMIKALECEIQAFKHKMLSVSFDEPENENMRFPERFQLNDEEIRCYLPEPYCNRRNFNVDPADGFGLYDGQLKDTVHRQAEEAKSLKVRLDNSDDALSSWLPQLQQDNAFSLDEQERRFSSFRVLQSDDSSSSSPCEDNTCKDSHVWHKSDVHDAQNIRNIGNDKSLEGGNIELREHIERLQERVQQLEKGTHWQQLDSEWTEARESPSRKLGANVVLSKNGSKCHLRSSSENVDSSCRLIEAAEETTGGNEGLSNFCDNSLYSRKRSILSQPVDNTSDRKPTANNVLECSAHRPFKRNADCFAESDPLPWNYEPCVATKMVLVNENKLLFNEQVTDMPSAGEVSRSAHITSADIMNEISKGNDAIPSTKEMPETSNTRNATFPHAMEDMNDRGGNWNDVPEVQNETERSGQCKSVNGNQDWCRDLELSPKRHNGHWAEYAPNFSERKRENMTDFSVKSCTEPGLDPTQNKIKQLVHRIQALEEERQCMKQTIKYFERENLSCIALLKEIARQHYEVQLLDKSKYDTKRIPSSEGLSILHVVKWIFSYVFRRNVQRCQSKYMHDASSHSVGLLLLLENTYKQRLGAYIRGVRINEDYTQYCLKNFPAEMRVKCV